VGGQIDLKATKKRRDCLHRPLEWRFVFADMLADSTFDSAVNRILGQMTSGYLM
jgi:hypothetical protein